MEHAKKNNGPSTFAYCSVLRLADSIALVYPNCRSSGRNKGGGVAEPEAQQHPPDLGLSLVARVHETISVSYHATRSHKGPGDLQRNWGVCRAISGARSRISAPRTKTARARFIYARPQILRTETLRGGRFFFFRKKSEGPQYYPSD